MQRGYKRPRGSSQIPYAPGSGSQARRGKKGPFALAVRSRRKRILSEGCQFSPLPYYAFGASQARTFPARMVTKLVYNEMSYLTFDNSTIAQPVYRLNSCYDIVTAIGGNQPYYYDTLVGANGTGAPYSRYRVLYSNIYIEFMNISNAGTGLYVGAGVGLNENGVSSTAAGQQLLMQRPGYRFAPLGVSTGSNNQRGWKIFVSHKDMLGVKDMKDAEDQAADYNSNPAGQEVNLMLTASVIDWADSTSRQVYYRLRVEQTVELMGLNVVEES